MALFVEKKAVTDRRCSVFQLLPDFIKSSSEFLNGAVNCTVLVFQQ
ncbi:MAG: hypothetical protein ACI935_003540, partial [Moritella dasanensis]